MKHTHLGTEASRTAQWVAVARSLGAVLPDEVALALDPYGVRFAHGVTRALAELLLRRPWLSRKLLMRAGPLTGFLLWMQLRTRALDDVLREFIASGGQQVVILGAGYDCRAVRFAHLLGDANLFEVDHPATQVHKTRVVSAAELRSPARYVEWDFERHGLLGLGTRLAKEGLSSKHRVLTIWEGVTMYLSESAIEQTLALVRGYGAAGSWLAFTYLDRRAVHTPRGDQWLTQRVVKSSGEPYRFGFEPAALPRWLSTRHFTMMWDQSDLELARRLLDPESTRHFEAQNRHVALAST